MLNTKIEVKYVDNEGSWHDEVIVQGTPTLEEISAARSNLIDSEYLIAHQVGLPSPIDESISDRGYVDPDVDHCYSTISLLDVTTESELAKLQTKEPYQTDLTVSGLLAHIASHDWDIMAESDRIGLI